nr:hypothetical protein [Tanacetum cinerariifolium]
MNDKIKDPKCVNHKVKISSHNYSKENFLATFTPQKQLTPEQIFWFQDLIKMKTEALKEQTTTSRPIKALMVYQPNTPTALFPRVLPTKNSFGNNPPTLDKDTLNFDSVFVIGKMQACLQGKDNVIRKLQKQISHLQETHSEADCTLDFRALDSQITQLTAKVTALQAQNDLFRAENDKIKQHYKELYDSIKITCAKHIEHVTALTTENVNLKTQILNTMKSVSKDHVKPKVLTLGKYVVD